MVGLRICAVSGLLQFLSLPRQISFFGLACDWPRRLISSTLHLLLKPVLLTPRRQPSLSRNATYLLGGRIALQSTQFLCLAVLTRLGSETTAGYYITSLAIWAPAILLADLQLHVDLATNRSKSYKLSDYFILRAITLTATAIVVLLGAVGIFGSGPLSYAVVGMGAMKLVESLCDLCGAAQLRDEIATHFATSLWLRGIGLILAMSLTFATTQNLMLACLATAAVWLVVLVFHDLPHTKLSPITQELTRFELKPTTKKLTRLAWRTMPLGAASLIGSLELNAPRYLTAGLLGLGEAGLFGIAAALTLGGQVIMAASVQTSLPRLALLHLSRNMVAFNRLRSKLCLVTLGIGCAQTVLLGLLGAFILKIVFDVAYQQATLLLVLTSIASTLLSLAAVQSNCLRSRGAYRASLVAHIISALTTYGAISLGISQFGLVGAGGGLSLAGGISILIFTASERLVTLRQSDRQDSTCSDSLPIPPIETSSATHTNSAA